MRSTKKNWKIRQTLPEQQWVASSRGNWLPFPTSSKGCHHKLHLYQLITINASEQGPMPSLNICYNMLHGAWKTYFLSLSWFCFDGVSSEASCRLPEECPFNIKLWCSFQWINVDGLSCTRQLHCTQESVK